MKATTLAIQYPAKAIRFTLSRPALAVVKCGVCRIGGEAQKYWTLPPMSSYKVSPTENQISRCRSRSSAIVLVGSAQRSSRRQSQNKATGRIHDKLFIRHWMRADGRHIMSCSRARSMLNHVTSNAVANLSGSLKPTLHSKPDGDQEDYSLARWATSCSLHVSLVKPEAWSTNFDLFEVPATGGATEKFDC